MIGLLLAYILPAWFLGKCQVLNDYARLSWHYIYTVYKLMPGTKYAEPRGNYHLSFIS